MAIDEFINLIIGGDIEQLLLYFPVFIIGVGILILVIIYVKDNSQTFLNIFSNIPQKFKKKPKQITNKKINETTKSKQVDYKKEIKNVLEGKNSTKAMDRLLILINQYFAQLFDFHYTFTYEELINKLEKRKEIGLKKFCENLLEVEFSKNKISKEELEKIAYEFLKITKNYPLKKLTQVSSKNFVKRIKFLNRLKRFKIELQRDLEKKRTIKDKISRIIEKVTKTIWKYLKGYFSSTKVPKKISFNVVLNSTTKHKKKKGLKTLFYEENPTIEGFFYFIYLAIRKKLRERQKIKKINLIIKEGRNILSETKDVIQVQNLYNSMSHIYNSLSNKNKRRMLQKIALFYNEINNIMKFQKANRYLLQLKLMIISNNNGKAQHFYSEASKLYKQMPSKYKNEIYKQFLNIEKELNMNTDKKGG